jgi:hypothetical protein
MPDNPRQDSRSTGYLAAMGVFGSLVTSGAALHKVRGTSLPAGYAVSDLLLGAVATHKFTRLITKDSVTTPLRAPFTTFEGPAGSAEVNESPKDGHVHTVGELLTCPFCLAPWVSSAYVFALGHAPRAARTWAAVFSVVAGSDFLQQAYGRVRAD